MSQHRIPPVPDDVDEPALRELWSALEVARPAPRPASERAAAWSAVAARLATADVIPLPVAPRPATTLRPARPAWATRARDLAGTLVLALVLLAGGLWSARITVTAPAGATRTVNLPDGSVAQLNGGSTLTWSRGFRRWLVADAATRDVTLDGEAFFTVTKGARPFVVHTWNASVTVLGTRFGVRARDERAGGTSVAVEEGRVRVAAAGDAAGAPVVLGAGQAGLVRAGAASPSASAGAPVEQLLAWRTGGFAAVDLPLDAIARELERRYAVRIDLRDPEAGGDRLTLYYPRPAGVEAILTDICTARALHFRRTSRGYEVY